MSKILLILCLVFLVSCSQKEVTSDQIVEKQELVYEVNSTTPFTGVIVDYHDNGELWSSINYKDGKREGLYETYYANGQLQVKETYKNDLQHGEFLLFYENGQVWLKGTFKYGLEQGEFLNFHENGQLSVRDYRKYGKVEGLYEIYYDNGQLKEKGSYEDGRKYQQGPTYNKYGTIK